MTVFYSLSSLFYISASFVMAFIIDNYGFKACTYTIFGTQIIYLLIALTGYDYQKVFLFYILLNRLAYSSNDILIDYFTYKYFDTQKSLILNSKLQFVYSLSSLLEITINILIFDPKNPLRIFILFTAISLSFNFFFISKISKLKELKQIEND